jgi:hypothetical protein
MVKHALTYNSTTDRYVGVQSDGTAIQIDADVFAEAVGQRHMDYDQALAETADPDGWSEDMAGWIPVDATPEDDMLPDACPACGCRQDERTCTDCGATAIVIDCGHFTQPAQIAGEEMTGEPVCTDCQEVRRAARTARHAQEEAEDALILTLCHEAGDEGPDADLIDGFRGNFAPDLIAAAAAGDVEALVELRTAVGLPFTR